MSRVCFCDQTACRCRRLWLSEPVLVDVAASAAATDGITSCGGGADLFFNIILVVRYVMRYQSLRTVQAAWMVRAVVAAAALSLLRLLRPR